MTLYFVSFTISTVIGVVILGHFSLDQTGRIAENASSICRNSFKVETFPFVERVNNSCYVFAHGFLPFALLVLTVSLVPDG